MAGKSDRDRIKTFGRITFAAVAVLLLGLASAALLASWALAGIALLFALLIFVSNLLLLTENGGW